MRSLAYFGLFLFFNTAICQDSNNVAILQGRPLTDGEEAFRREMCQQLSDTGGIGQQGTRIFSEFLINSILEDYLDANPPIDDWTGRLYRDELIFQAADNFRCLEENDNCAVARTCEEYFLSNGPWISMSIHNAWRIMRAQIKGYDRAIEKFDANNQELAKLLFSSSGLGRNRLEFDFGVFLDGVLLGASLVFPAFGSASVGATFTNLFKSQLEGLALDAVLGIADFFGPNPTEDGSPFVNNLRIMFRPLQTALRATMRGYMDTGITNLQLQNTNRDIVDFLQSGELLNDLGMTDEQMVDFVADEIIRQVSAPIVAKIWFDQGVKTTRHNAEFCANPLCFLGNNCGAFKDSGFPFVADQFPVRPICSGWRFDLPADLPVVLGRLNLPVKAITMNAELCNRIGKSGIFPPEKEDFMDFGFPRCTWALESLAP
ncbi:hypothetical protein LTR84_005965 [Exophiala bonariae]|uniref:Heme haloperoxidase family profile domain-containing protein n=1 Tax=Exophiala bonariae TaxID=1690606 RepID=A0AAV9N2G6_9EURO|nr:hypothetical protein LTR84_005965 [Exophiala bonariae]